MKGINYLLGLMNNAEIKNDEITIKSPEIYWALRIKNRIELMGYPSRINKKKDKWIVSIENKELIDLLMTYKSNLDPWLWTMNEKKDYLKALITSTGVITGNELIIKAPPKTLIILHKLLNEFGLKNSFTPTQIRLNAKKTSRIIGFDIRRNPKDFWSAKNVDTFLSTNEKIKQVIAV